MRVEMRTLVERASRWLVTNRRPPLDSQATVDFFAGPVQAAMAEAARADERARAGRLRGARRTRWSASGVPEELASKVAVLPPAYMLLNVIEIADARVAGRRRRGAGALRAGRAARAAGAGAADPGAAPRRPVADDGPRGAARRPPRGARPADRAGAAHDVGRRVRPRRGSRPGRTPSRSLVTRAAATLQQICADENGDLARMSVGLRVVRGLLD